MHPLILSKIISAITIALVLLAADRITANGGTLGIGIIATCQSIWQWMNDGLLTDMFYTLARVFLGFAIAIIFGVFIGLITGRFVFASSGAVHTLNYLRAVTPVALAPFFLVAFGISEISKVLLVAWGAFFPIWITAHLGAKSLSIELVSSARLIGLSGVRMIRHFYLPATIGAAYPGARVAIGISFILVYISETLGADFGVGYQLGVAYDTLQIPRMTAALLLLGALGLATDRIFVSAVRHLAPWITFERHHENSTG